MAKAKEYASSEEAEYLKELLSELKEQTGDTYYELAKRLNKPCTDGTLQQRVSYPRKQLSKNLYSKIINAVNDYKSQPPITNEEKIDKAILASKEVINQTIQDEMSKLKTTILDIQSGHQADI